FFVFFFQAEDGIRDKLVTGVQTCALPISSPLSSRRRSLGLPCHCWAKTKVRSRPVKRATRIRASSAATWVLESAAIAIVPFISRSEERRVGKECRCRWEPDHEKKKKV